MDRCNYCPIYEKNKRLNAECRTCDFFSIVAPDGATNGDMIKAMFSVETVDDFCRSFGVRLNNSNYIQFNKDWWNAPYKRGEK